MSKVDESVVVGWVLTHEEDDVFQGRLADYDTIQGFLPDQPTSGLYKRDIVQVMLKK